MSLAYLPAHWQAALLEIAALRSRPYKGVVCIPGGGRVVRQLVDFGAVEVMAADPRYCTLTPWGAELIGVALYEWEDEGEPCWVRAGMVAVLDAERQGVPTRGERGQVRWHSMDLLNAWQTREWHADEGETPEPAPVVDEWENPVALFAGADGPGLSLFRESDLKAKRRAEARAKRERKKAAKAANRRQAS